MNIEHWKQFESTGRIEDYLHFLSCERQERSEREADSGNAPGAAGDSSRDWMDHNSHAGIYIGDRNHIEANPGRGIRQTYQPFD